MSDAGNRVVGPSAAPAAEPAPLDAKLNHRGGGWGIIMPNEVTVSANVYLVRNSDGSTTNLMTEILHLRAQIKQLQSEIIYLKQQKR